MIFSYRTRQFLRRMFTMLLHIALAAVGLLLVWLLWLQRFVLYTPQGAVLDFGLTAVTEPGQVAEKPQGTQVNIEYLEGAGDAWNPSQPEGPIAGYVIEASALTDDISAVRARLETLPAGTAVLLDVKSYWGYFYYSTALGKTSSAYIISEMDALIEYLTQSDLYVIARLPALRDYDYALNNTSDGLPTKQGYLWADSGSCYWLDPTTDGTLTHLIQIAKELRSMGIDEVVFTDFYIPEASAIVFAGDRKEAIEQAAQTLASTCATDKFTVSFVLNDASVSLPEGSRAYFENVAAADVQDVLDQVNVADKAGDVVFLCSTNDTRYDVSGTLRPLSQAH